MTEIAKVKNQELKNLGTNIQENENPENSYAEFQSKKRRGRPKCFNEQSGSGCEPLQILQDGNHSACVA